MTSTGASTITSRRPRRQTTTPRCSAATACGYRRSSCRPGWNRARCRAPSSITPRSSSRFCCASAPRLWNPPVKNRSWRLRTYHPHYPGARVAHAAHLGELLTRTAPRPAPLRDPLVMDAAARAANKPKAAMAQPVKRARGSTAHRPAEGLPRGGSRTGQTRTPGGQTVTARTVSAPRISAFRYAELRLLSSPRPRYQSSAGVPRSLARPFAAASPIASVIMAARVRLSTAARAAPASKTSVNTCCRRLASRASCRVPPAMGAGAASPMLIVMSSRSPEITVCGTCKIWRSRSFGRTSPVAGAADALDLGGRFGSAVFDGGLERGVVAFVLVGVGFGEVGDRLVELRRSRRGRRPGRRGHRSGRAPGPGSTRTGRRRPSCPRESSARSGRRISSP